MAENTAGPESMSQERAARSAVYAKIADIRAGAEAIRAAGATYLPKYEDEDDSEYRRRVSAAPWRPEFVDALQTLAAKPFQQDISVEGAASAEMQAIVADVDTKGNNLSVFAAGVFENGIADGVAGILVDYPKDGAAATLAEQKARGVRPYWVEIKASNILALRTSVIAGRTVVSHVRLAEETVESDGAFGEVVVKRVRVLEPGTWALYRRNRKNGNYDLEESGTTTLSEVPLVLFKTAKDGNFPKPPLADLAEMQIELYRQLSREDEILTFAGSPMMVGVGFARPDIPPSIGPKRILYAPPGDTPTDFKFIQPNAANIAEVRNKVQATIDDMRRLGMQPMTQRVGGVTAKATTVESLKAHSRLQAWAVHLKDALEQAFVFTGMWLGEASAMKVTVFTDFSVETSTAEPVSALTSARKNGDISRRTYWHGLKRFKVLPSDFNEDDEDERLAEEGEDLTPEEQIDPATGEKLPADENDPAV